MSCLRSVLPSYIVVTKQDKNVFGRNGVVTWPRADPGRPGGPGLPGVPGGPMRPFSPGGPYINGYK